MKTTNREWSAFEHTLRGYVARRVEMTYVDDLVGEILLRLVRHEADFKTASKPTAWMFRVATNVITDHYRRHSVEQGIMENLELPELTDVIDRDTDITPQEELARCLVPLIEKLPPQYRQALQLIDIDGLPQQKAATLVGLSLSGMKSRIQRGRVKLRELLLNCCAIELNRRGNVVDYVVDSKCC